MPGVYIDRIYKSDPKSPFSEKRIEKLTVQSDGKTEPVAGKKDMEVRMKIIKRAAK